MRAVSFSALEDLTGDRREDGSMLTWRVTINVDQVAMIRETRTIPNNGATDPAVEITLSSGTVVFFHGTLAEFMEIAK